MASSKKEKEGTPCYPVWVGNLHDSVSESTLKQKFSGFGSIQSCSIMRDTTTGKTKNFGYVNFVSKHNAENAAKKLNGKELEGKAMKTKGPSVLRKEGHLKRQAVINYRPLTDCTFFIEGGRCTKGQECPYRHSEVARDSELCTAWMNRMCTKRKCPKRHPRLTDSRSGSNTPVKSHSQLSIDSDSDDADSIDYPSYDDSTSDLSSNLSISPSPGTSTGTSPYLRSSNNSNTSGRVQHRNTVPTLGSTQSFSFSSDEEEIGNDFINNSRFKLSDLTFSSSDEEDNEIDDPMLINAFQSLSRLTSLTESRKQALTEDTSSQGDSNGNSASSSTDKLKLSGSFEEGSAFKKVLSTSNNAPNAPPAPEPVGLFWDIENCSVPLDKSAFALANKMRQVFFKGKREVEFMCVCDITKERKEVTDDLHRAHVTLVHVNATAKNAADDKLKHSLRRFAQTFHPPATVVLVSGDVNFSFELNDLRHVHHMTTILVHNANTSEALKVCAHQTILFEDFVEDVSPQQRVAPPTATVLIAHGLPTMDMYKIKNRLSRLADNCGGKVLHVDPVLKTARILFKSQEYALKAMKRMTGEDVYGRKIRLELEQPQQKSNSQQRPPQTHNRHAHMDRFPPPPPIRPTGGPPMIHGPRGAVPFLPRGPHPHGPGPHPHGPHPMQQHRPGFMPLPPRQMMPHPQFQVPPPPPSGSGYKFMVKGLIVSEEIEFDSLTTIFSDIRMSVHIKASPPVYLWESYSRACLLSEFLLRESAEIKAYQPILNHLRRNLPIPIELAKSFADICVSDLNKHCQVNKIPWRISLCQWKPEEELGRGTLSNIVSLLKKSDKHWAKFELFKLKYMDVYNRTLSEMMIQEICGDAIQLLSSTKSDTVILFAEFSPLVKIRKTDEFLKNSLSLIESQPGKKIRLIEFVEAYQSKFSKLKFTKNGSDLQEIFSSDPSFFISGIKPSASMVCLKTNSPVPSVSPTCPSIDLANISREFVQLVKDSPGQQVALNCFQQSYQTKFHKSFRVSDIIPGESGVKALIEKCQGVKCIPIPTSFGNRHESVVVLDQTVPIPRVSPVCPSNDLANISQEFVQLVKDSPGQQVALNCFQQNYQTKFHKSFRVSDIIPGESGVKALIEKCQGVKCISMPYGNRHESVVVLDQAMPSSSTKTTPMKIPPMPRTPKGSVSPVYLDMFRQDMITLLQTVPGGRIAVSKIPDAYSRHYKRNYQLANYGGVKTIVLLKSIPETVMIDVEGDEKVVQLISYDQQSGIPTEHHMSKDQCEQKIEAMIYHLPNHQTTLDRFLYDYEAYHKDKLTHYCGHAKLLLLLQDMKKTIEIDGNGARRIIRLVPLRLFACRIREMLTTVYPEGMKLSCVVPEYNKRFRVEFTADVYGKSKLLQVMECIPDVVKITGEGPKRIVTLASPPILSLSPTTPPKSQSPVSKTRPSSIARLLFMDEVTSLLFSYFDKELTLEKLCEKYYITFKKQINLKELNYKTSYDAVKDLTNVQVIGEGFSAIVRLKSETISPEPTATPTTTEPMQTTPTLPDLTLPTITNPDPPQPLTNDTTTTISSLNTQEEDTPDPVVKPLTTRPRLCRTICVRLLSEIHRTLLSHPEHSMTIEELCTTFKDYDEPSLPSPEDLRMALDTYSGNDNTYKFNVNHLSSDVTLVSLTQSDAMWKLSRDLVYLFVYCPCDTYTVTLERLIELYKECYKRKLNPLVYKCDTVTELMKRKQLKHCINFNEDICTVSLHHASRIEVFTQLACELLFRLESECGHIDEFTGCYEEYFKCPLVLSQLQVSSLKELLTQPGVNQYIEFSEVKGHLTLTPKGLYCEQLRHLLTVHKGRIPEDLLLTMYLSEFRHPLPQYSQILKWLTKTPSSHAPHIANLACELYIVWAPVGRAYPSTRALAQSKVLPYERSVTLEELGDVPELVSSVMSTSIDSTPVLNLTLPELISEYVNNDMPELVDDDDDDDDEDNHTGVSPLIINDLSATPTNLQTNNLTTPTNVLTTPIFSPDTVPSFTSTIDNPYVLTTPTKHSSDTPTSDESPPLNQDEITGLDHGEFAGLRHQSVVAQMQQEMRGNEMDTSGKIQRMNAFVDYFGEIAEMELNRVNPRPVPKPRRNKSKSRLAIQFPGSVTTSSEDTSPKTSPVSVHRIPMGTTPDCLPQSNTVHDSMVTDWGQ